MEDRKRIAKAVDDEDLPEIDSVYHAATPSSTLDVVDPFTAKGEDLKKYSGVAPGFKRKISNELRKYNRSTDRQTESKQITDKATVSGYDAFGVVTPPHSLEGLALIYEMSSPHYSAVNAKVSNIAGLGYKFVETTKTKRALEDMASEPDKLDRARKRFELARDGLSELIESLNEEETFSEIIQKVWLDYEVMGNGYLEVGRKADGTIGYLGHIPAQTIRVRRDGDGFVQLSANRAQFFRHLGDDAPNPIGSDQRPNELIHIKKYSPTSTFYGVPDILAAQQAIAANKFIADFNLEYFENKAVPRHVITLKGATLGAAGRSELLTFFETHLKGQHHRTLFIPLPAGTKDNPVEFSIDPVEANVQEASFTKFMTMNRNEILMAHRVPLSKVSTADGASLAIARDADKTFKEQVCQPQQRIFEKKLNRIIKEFTDAFELKLNEMALTDANTQSQIDERMVKNGIWTANEVRLRDGMPGIDGGDERVDLNAAAKAKQQVAEATANRQRDSVRSANQTDNVGEARNPKGDGRTTP